MTALFLTGACGAGKSTILRRALAMHPVDRIGGFLTVTRSGDFPGERGGVYLLPADKPDAPVSAENLVGIRHGYGHFTAFPEVFDRVGGGCLEQSRRCSLIVMDELGRMEENAGRFQRAVFSCLDGEIPVLGVLKAWDAPFLRQVRAHPGVRVVEVTPENREAGLKTVLCWLEAYGS